MVNALAYCPTLNQTGLDAYFRSTDGFCVLQRDVTVPQRCVFQACRDEGLPGPVDADTLE